MQTVRSLRDLPQIHRQHVVGFIGGGGKTTLILENYKKAIADNIPVVATTTTRLLKSEADHFDALCNEKDFFPTTKNCFIYSHVQNGKIFGPKPNFIAGLAALQLFVLCESDGSQKKPLKGFAGHEPALTGKEDAVVMVIGMNALGESFHDDRIHRLETVKSNLGKIPKIIDVSVIEDMIVGHNGYLAQSSAPKNILVFNNVNTDKALKASVRLAENIACSAALARGSVFGEDEYGFYRSCLLK